MGNDLRSDRVTLDPLRWREPGQSPLRGRVAIASGRIAYQRYLAKFAGSEWEKLKALGAQTQRPLWASTGTKNPAYSEVLYVAELISRDVIKTMPEQTLRALADHGEVAPTLDTDPAEPEQVLAELLRAGIKLDAVTVSSNVKVCNRSATPTDSCSPAREQPGLRRVRRRARIAPGER
jgi:transaldolase / glucose-6-phosphate isomerase